MTAKNKNIEALFRLYYRPLCLYASRYLPSADIVEDVVQESFIAFWNKTREGFVPDSAKSYLYRIVHNRCMDAISNNPQYESLQEHKIDIVDSENEERSFVWANLWTAIDELPEKRREVFLLHKRDGLTYEQIASQLGISKNTVHNHITKALQALRGSVRKIFLYFFA